MSEDDASKADHYIRAQGASSRWPTSLSNGGAARCESAALYTRQRTDALMSLFKAASTVSLLTLASRVTGLVRELLMAATFGATRLTDAFNVAFRIPNLFRRLFGEGAFSQAFVPALAHSRQADGDAATHRLIDSVATVLAWSLLADLRRGRDRRRRCWSGRWPAASSRRRTVSRPPC